MVTHSSPPVWHLAKRFKRCSPCLTYRAASNYWQSVRPYGAAAPGDSFEFQDVFAPCRRVFAQNGAFSHIRIELDFLSLTYAPIRRATATKDVNMKHIHSAQNNEGRPIASIALKTAGSIGAVILSGLLVASCAPRVTDLDAARVAPTRALTKTVAERHFVFERFGRPGNQRNTAHSSNSPWASDAPIPINLYRFALNALLVPLMDDADLPRWTRAAIDLNCGPGTIVTVDGSPLVAGKLIPATAFTVRWDMDHCAPMGTESVALSGRAELVVFHEDEGLSAMLMPDGLRVTSQMGTAWLHGPSTAETPLVTAAIRQ